MIQQTPLLAAAAGHYWEDRPMAPLRDHFRRVWTHAVTRPPDRPVAVTPDGCVDILWIDGRLAVAGPDIAPAFPALRRGATIIGARFQPGAAAHWLRLPMSEIIGQQVDLADLWGARARDLAGMIGDGDTTGARLERMQSLLTAMAPQIDAPAADMRALFACLTRGAAPGDRIIPRLLERLDVSERTFRRRCHQHFGYGAKTLDRILRFQTVLHLARQTPRISLSMLALDAGYSDQAHLSREVQAFAAMPPSALLRQLVVGRSVQDGPARPRHNAPDTRSRRTLIESIKVRKRDRF